MGIPMRHPDLTTYADHFDGYPEALNEEQADQWAKTGWVRVIGDDVDLNQAGVDDLKAMVEQAKADGRDIKPASTKKADLVKALEADRTAVRAEAEQAERFQGP